MTTRSYNFADVQVIIGEIIVGGYADGVTVSLVPLADDYTERVGNDGEVTRSRTNNNAWTLTLTLNQSSTTNTTLHALRNLDRLTGAGVRPLTINDPSGATVASARNCWIKRAPDLTFGQESENRVWTLIADDVTIIRA